MSVRLLSAQEPVEVGPGALAPGRIPVADLEVLVVAGEAMPLFPEFAVGPTWYEGLWWVIPAGQWDLGFTVASEADQAELSATFLRLAEAERLLRVAGESTPQGQSRDELTADEWAEYRAADRVADADPPGRPEAGRARSRWMRRGRR